MYNSLTPFDKFLLMIMMIKKSNEIHALLSIIIVNPINKNNYNNPHFLIIHRIQDFMTMFDT